MTAMAGPSSPALLRVVDLEVRRSGLVVVPSITFDVRVGERLVLAGPNGAGKTSVLRAVAGLESSTGRVELDGVDIAHAGAPERWRRGMAFVPGIGGTFSGLSVRENLLLAVRRRDRAEGRRDLDDVLAAIPRLAERSRVRAGRLSGGERRLLGIARALLARPRLLLADEPLAGLAPDSVERVSGLLGLRSRLAPAAILVSEEEGGPRLEGMTRRLDMAGGRLVVAQP